MNRTYRLVWNRALRVVQVASELASGAGGDTGVATAAPMRRRRLWGALVAAGLCTAISPAFAQVCQPTASGACSAPGAAANPNASAGGAGNGMGGGAIAYDTDRLTYTPVTGGQSNAGVGGSGAVGTASPSGTTAAGGTGGTVGGVPGASAVTGARGNNGTDSDVSPGGGGGGGAGFYTTAATLPQAITSTVTGGAGGTGGSRLPGFGTGGAGGGGGGAGLISTANAFTVELSGAASAITGGAGGAGGNGATNGTSYGGGGGGGGDGILLFGTGATVTNGGTITGGVGGAGGSGATGTGNAGASGAGIRALNTGFVLNNSGTIIGGAAPAGGAAGVGVITQGSSTLTNSGTLAGGMGAVGRASAVLFNGVDNRLQLNAGSVIQGAIELANGATVTVATTVASALNGVLFDGNATNLFINTAATGASVDLGGTITGGGNVAGNGDGTVTLGAVTIGGTLSMAQAGGTHTTAQIQTGLDQNYFTPVMLDAATAFVATGGPITFGSTVDGAQNMSVTTPGALSFQAPVGATTGLSSLTTRSQSLSLGSVNAGSLALTTLAGPITSTGALTVSGASQFDAGTNDITLVDGGNQFGGTVTATGRNITLATAGALDDLTINASGTASLKASSIAQTTGSIVAGTLTATTTDDITLSSTANQIGGLGDISARDVSLGSSALVNIVGTVDVQTLDLSTTAGALLSGKITTASGTTINAGSSLTVDAAAASGALDSGVVDNGQLVWNGANVYTGALTGTGQLIKQGTGALVVNGDAGNFAGNTTVSGGSLIVGGAAGSTVVLGGASVDVQNGGTLGGHGVVAGDVNVQGGGAIAPGNSIGTLRIGGNLTLASGSAINAEFAAGGISDRVIVAGNLVLAGGSTLNVTDAGGMGHGLYTVLSYGGTATGTLTLGTTPANQSLALQNDTVNRQVNLLDSTTAALSFWNANRLASSTQLGGGSGTWSVTAPNWTDSVGSVTAAMSPQPSFGIFAGAAGTVTVDGSAGQVVANGMQFASDGYQVTGDSLQLVTTDGSVPLIRVGDGSSVGAAYTATVASTLTGTQGLEKADAGTLVLSGANTYTGNTVISGGTLSVAADNNLGDAANGVTLQGGTLGVAGPAYVATDRLLTLATGSGGTLAIADAGNIFNWRGDITGAGTLTVQGPGTLLLDHANSYTGDTVVNGTLLIDANGAIGTGALVLNGGSRVALYAAGATLANNVIVNGEATVDAGAGSAVLSGNVTAGGADPTLDNLHKTGTGTLLLTGAASPGTFSIDAGTLQVGNGGTSGQLIANVVNNGALVFNRADNTNFDGVLSGGGSVNKLGAGNLQLTGDSSAFSGSTSITSGSLQVDGKLGGSLTFASGTTFAGNGTAGNVTLQSGSILSPGGAGVGTLSTSGDLMVAAGTQYSLDLDNAGHSDTVAVGGKATLQGGSVVSLASAAGKWSPTATYTILTAANGVSGTFSDVSSNLAFLTPQLAYTANAVNLTLIRNDILFADIGATHNQRATAAAIESIGEDQPVFNTVVKLDAASARRAYDQLSGEIHANLQGAIADDDRYKREAINQHLLTQFADETEDSFATWASAWGHRGHHDEDGNASKLDASGSGFFIGADKGIADRSRIGIALGSGRVSADARDDSASGNTLTAAIYGGADFGDVMIQAGGIYSRYDIDTHRTVDVDSLAGRLSGTTKAHSLQGFVEGSYEFRWDSGALAPFVNIAQQELRTNASNERGSDAALHIMGNKSDLTYGTFGVRGRKDFGEDGRFGIFGSVGWQHAAGDTDTSSKQRFLEGGNAFEVMGTPVGKNAGVGVFGVRFLATPTVTIDASWNGQFASEAKDQSARLALNWVF